MNIRKTMEKPEEKKPFGRPRRRWGIILKWIFEKWDGEVWTGLQKGFGGETRGKEPALKTYVYMGR